MAIVEVNSITKSLRGTLGKLVFRQVNGQVIVTPKPRRRKKQTEQQRENRMKFQAAARWARSVTRDPKMKLHYQRIADKMKLPNAYTAALSDYLRKSKNAADIHISSTLPQTNITASEAIGDLMGSKNSSDSGANDLKIPMKEKPKRACYESRNAQFTSPITERIIHGTARWQPWLMNQRSHHVKRDEEVFKLPIGNGQLSSQWPVVQNSCDLKVVPHVSEVVILQLLYEMIYRCDHPPIAIRLTENYVRQLISKFNFLSFV